MSKLEFRFYHQLSIVNNVTNMQDFSDLNDLSKISFECMQCSVGIDDVIVTSYRYSRGQIMHRVIYIKNHYHVKFQRSSLSNLANSRRALKLPPRCCNVQIASQVNILYVCS